MEQCTRLIREKQYSFKQDIRRNKLDLFIAKRRSENSQFIEESSQSLSTRFIEQSQIPSSLIETLRAFPPAPENLLCQAYSILSQTSPSCSQSCSQYINLLFSYITQKSNRVAYQIICHWIPSPEISKYVFINQLFKELPYHENNSEFSSYNIHIFKVLSETLSTLTSDSQFLIMSYRLLENLLLRWSLNEEPLYFISAINLLKEDISIQAVILLVEENISLLSTLAAKLKSPDTDLNHKLLYSTFIQYIFYNGEEVILSLMLSGYADTIKLLLEDDRLLPLGLSCLECILEMETVSEDIQILISENRYIEILNCRIIQYLESEQIVNKGVENNIVKCILASAGNKCHESIVLNLERYVPASVKRLEDPSLSLDTLMLLRREMERSGEGRVMVIRLLKQSGAKEVLQNIVETQKQQYSRELAEQILESMGSAMEEELETA